MKQAAEITRLDPNHLTTGDSLLSGLQVPSSVGQQALNSLLGAKDGDNPPQPGEGEEESENEENSAMSTSPEVCETNDVTVSLFWYMYTYIIQVTSLETVQPKEATLKLK